MKQERDAIDRMSVGRYVLATSRPLSPKNKQDLAAVIGPCLRSEADIFGPDDLRALVRKYPDIEKSHIKLWLTSASVLDRVIRSAAHTFTSITKEEIDAKVRVYAPNPSFSDARDTLEASHVVIISGPPGVGKTTLAEMLSYTYLADDWELVAIRSLDDGLAAIDDTKKQVFLFDDFLGRVALDRHALSHKDSDLARFIRRTRASPNARFILTTRAYIFEEARRVSEYLADRRLDIAKYVLDVGVYTRRIKARILYNHLLVAKTPQKLITSLVQSGDLGKIVDHKNYNPRIIEWMTDVDHIGKIEADAYPASFLDALAHPGQLWDIAFRTHISRQSQHLLLALFFGSEYGVNIEDLQVAYEGVHPFLCAKYGESYDPKDFEESVRILEGGFIALAGKSVSFVNPSLRDYLTEYLDDLTLLVDFASAACQTDWAQSVWRHGKRLKLNEAPLASFASSFLKIAEQFCRLPVWKRTQVGHGYSLSAVGLSNINRIELLIAWWEASKDRRFLNYALALSLAPVDGLDSWRDGEEAVELIGKLRDGYYFEELLCADELAENLEVATIDMIYKGMPSDELEKISDAADNWKKSLGDGIFVAIDVAIKREIDEVGAIVADIDSDSTLNDHVETLRKLSMRASIPPQDLDRAVNIVFERIAEVEGEAAVSRSPSFGVAPPNEGDPFDDLALQNLFAPLKDL